MIDQATIGKIIDTADIVEVIQEFVSLKKRGVNYIGLCPFHNEKKPSFTVSQAKGIYKCFGCDKGGNVVNFIMQHESLTYPEALKYLANKYHIEIVEKEQTQEEIQQKNERESLLIVSSYAQKYFTETLHKNEEGIAVGLSYFKERGFQDHIIEKFQLGYCLDKKDGFTNSALSKGYNLDYLVKTGLTIKKDDYKFDRFSARVIFPIHSLSGSVVGYGGRTLKSDDKAAKYLNSPESELYHKSKELYGIYFAKKSIVANDKCYLVEGYTDVLSMHQAGIENTVASSGTALTDEQIRLLKRFTKNVTILFDSDIAGKQASLRGIDLILEQGMNVKTLLLPEGEDPDSYCHKLNSSELINYIENNEKDFIAFKIQLFISEAKNDPVKRANLVTDIVRSIAVIPEKIVRSEYIKECSNILDTKEQILHSEVNKIISQKAKLKYYKDKSDDYATIKPVSAPLPYYIKEYFYEPQEREIIRLLLNYGNFEITFQNAEDDKEKSLTIMEFIINEFQSNDLKLIYPVYNKIFEEYQNHLNNGIRLDDKYFINHSDEEISKLTANLISSSYDLSKIWIKHKREVPTEEMKLKKIVIETLILYKNKKVCMAIEEAEEQLKKAQEENLTDEVKELQQKIIVLNDYKMLLSKDLEITIL